jgi:uroporphyrinogen-III decarboxylase
MPYPGCVQDFQAIRRGRLPERVPVAALSEEFDVKWHGQYTYEEFCRSGEKICEVYRAAIDHFDYDCAWVQIDDCFEFEPIGVGVHGEDNILRATCEYLPATRATLESLPVMNPLKDGRMPEKLKALRLLREHYDDSCLIVGSCAAPFSAVGLMWSIEESMVMLLTDPDLLRDAMQYWCDFYKRYIQAQRDAGAHAIWLGDCNAFSNLVSVPQYAQHILPVTRELVQYCEKDLDVMIWLHNSETQVEHVLSHLPLGCSFENIGPTGDMRRIREATRDKLAISGNLDPLEVLWKGTPSLVAGEVERIMGICKPGGAYIANTGEMNPRDVSEDNMLAYVRTAKELGKY